MLLARLLSSRASPELSLFIQLFLLGVSVPLGDTLSIVPDGESSNQSTTLLDVLDEEVVRVLFTTGILVPHPADDDEPRGGASEPTGNRELDARSVHMVR